MIQKLEAEEKQIQSKSKGQKPAWAKTENQQVKDEEKEIDDLIEFAYELDYEKYVEDQEIKQALALIKHRVKDLKARQQEAPTLDEVRSHQSQQQDDA